MNCFQDKLAEGCLVELKRWFSRRSGTQSGHHSTPTPAQSPFKDSMTIMKQWQQESAQKKRALGEEENIIPEDANGHQQSHHNKKKPRVEEKAMAVEEEKEEKTAAEVSVQHFVEELPMSSSPVKQSQKPSDKVQPIRKKRNQVKHAVEQEETQSTDASSAGKAVDDDSRDQQRAGAKSTTASIKKRTEDISPSSSSSSSAPPSSTISSSSSKKKEPQPQVVEIQSSTVTVTIPAIGAPPPASAHEIFLKNTLSSSAQVALKSYLGIA
jgi:hypothetical protein